jgi:hypothetical protein
MKARRKRDLLILNSKSYQSFIMTNLRNFQNLYAIFGVKNQVSSYLPIESNFFLDIFTWFDRAR